METDYKMHGGIIEVKCIRAAMKMGAFLFGLIFYVCLLIL